MPKHTTLNRFPLFGLFSHEAAKKMGYTEDDARLLGHSTALLYAIFKAKATWLPGRMLLTIGNRQRIDSARLL